MIEASRRVTGRLCAALLAFGLAGCASIGPERVIHDRFDYSSAVGESWKQQMLLNMVKLRYGDAPVFMNVSSVVAGYSLSQTIGASASAPTYTGSIPNGDTTGTYGASIGATYSDNPTISFVPMTGEEFARALMKPIPPSAILTVVESGFPVDRAFLLTVQSVNGIDNRRVEEQYVQPADPEFYALLKSLRRIQTSNDIGVRIGQKDRQDLLEFVLRPKPAAAVDNARLNVARILGLDPTATIYEVQYGSVAESDKQIAMVSRSILQVLEDLATYIEAPPRHVAEHRVAATPMPDLGPNGPIDPLLRVHSSAKRPEDAFVAVPYRGYWFWIDDRDLSSKQLFSYLMFIFTFIETGSSANNAPVLTIPVR